MATAENLPGQDPREKAAQEFAKQQKKQRSEQEAMREAADKSGIKYEETEGGYAVSGGTARKEKPALKVIEGGKEEKPTLMISSEKERQEMFDELTKSFSEGKIDLDQFTGKYNDIYQAEVEETLVEVTQVTPDQYIDLQDTIKKQFKDPKEQAEKLALLDETTELVVDEKAEEEKREGYDLKDLVELSDQKNKQEAQATSGALKNATELLERGILSADETRDIVTDAFILKASKNLKEGKMELYAAIGLSNMIEGDTEKLQKAVNARKAELTKQARVEMDKGIDAAYDRGDLSFSSEEFEESQRAYKDQARKIQDELGINIKNPSFSDRFKIQVMKLQPAKRKAYFDPLESFRTEYQSKVNQVTEKAPQSLSSKPLAELQRAGMVSAAKIPEKTLSPEEKLERDLESGEISLNEYLKITNAADKVREGLEEKHRKNLADIEILKNTPLIMKSIDEMKKEGIIDVSSTDYQKAVHDLYTSKQWLETNANYDPNKGFFANWARAREAQIDMSQYKKYRKQYLEAEKRFHELNSILEKANFWGEAEIIEAIAPAATEPQGQEAPTPFTTNKSAPDTTKRTNA